MTENTLHLYDAHKLPHAVDQITTGATQSVAISDGDEVVALIVRATTETPAGWIVASHNFDDRDVPGPFATLKYDSNNIGASVWIHVSTAAMIAALPTAKWNEHGRFEFYYWAPGLADSPPIRLEEWTVDQQQWGNEGPNGYLTRHEEAVAYFNRAVNSIA